MKMKAQVEFIVIIALVLIGVVVVVIASRSAVVPEANPAVTGLEQEKKTVSDSVTNAIRAYARDELLELYKTGGALNTTGYTVKYGTRDVGVWYDCGDIAIPNVEKTLETRLEKKLKETFKSEMDFAGKTARFDVKKIDVTVSLQGNGIKIDVAMPTTVENSAIPQPYSIFMQSTLKNIIATAQQIVSQNNASQFLESATINTLLHSNPDNMWLPTADLKTGCSGAFFKTDSEITSSMEEIVKYTTSHTVFNRDVMNLNGNPFYVMGISDVPMDVAFVYPDGWNLVSKLTVNPSPAAFYPRHILDFSSECIEIMNVKYSMRYPAIVAIKDEPLGQLFTFAIMVNINDNKPGCGFSSPGEDAYFERCTAESACEAHVQVKDSDGLGINGALVTFGGCTLGETNSLGFVSSKVPCMIGEMAVQKDGYMEYKKLVKSSELRDYTAVMGKDTGEITVHFYGVPMKPGELMGGGAYKDYTVTGQPRSIDLFSKKYFVLAYIKQGSGESIMLYNIGANGFTGFSNASLRSEVFDIFIAATDTGNGNAAGYADGSYMSGGSEKELYVYVPIVEGQLTSLSPGDIYKLEAAMQKCGMDIVSEQAQSVTVPCV
ncbi:MAG: hypothetical protein NTU57_04795 [Candidatus Aenigmarchaeota archaeon]|nr:hypothetical protein [Candidatus Aenigmarchaeota archaeon]